MKLFSPSKTYTYQFSLDDISNFFPSRALSLSHSWRCLFVSFFYFWFGKKGQVLIILLTANKNVLQNIEWFVFDKLNWNGVYTYLAWIKCSSNVHTAGIHSMKDVGWHTWIVYTTIATTKRSDEHDEKWNKKWRYDAYTITYTRTQTRARSLALSAEEPNGQRK